MYLKLVLATCALAFFAVVLSAYARLSDAGLGCSNWPACYEQNAQKENLPSQSGAQRAHASWQWKLHAQVVQLLGILAIAVCGYSYKNRKVLRQSPLLPTMLLGLMLFLAIFGIVAPKFLSHPALVTVHLAGSVAMLTLLIWIALGQSESGWAIDAEKAKKLRPQLWLGFALICAEIALGGWVSSNFASLACVDFPLCRGSLVPPMDFAGILHRSASPLSVEQLTAIHWLHRVGALLIAVYLGWLSARMIALDGGRRLGKIILGLVVLQILLGIANVLAGLMLFGTVLHNALAMALVASLSVSIFRVKNGESRN